jgi:3-methyladenine DNA glycosylase/8-oxoguanine DNA glycosylase
VWVVRSPNRRGHFRRLFYDIAKDSNASIATEALVRIAALYAIEEEMRPFKGVASWYLPSYLGWRRAIERLGENFTPERRLQAACRCGST